MDPIAGLGPIVMTPPGAAVPPSKSVQGDFSSVLNKALSEVSLKQHQANELSERFQLGDPSVSLEKTMVALQTANISFQALLQVRNRAVAAYQDVMNMPV